MSTRVTAPPEVFSPFSAQASGTVEPSFNGMPRKLRLALWTAVVLLTVVGIAPATLRSTIVTRTLATPPSARGALEPLDQAIFEALAKLPGALPATAERSDV